MSNTTKVLLIIPPQNGDDIMSTVEYVESLKQRRYELFMALGNFMMSHEDYERTVKQFKAVCDELSFYRL